MFEESEIYKAILEKSEQTPEKTLTALKQGNVNVNIRNNQQETFLHVVARTYIEDDDAPALIPVVFQLSNAGIDVNAVDENGNNALHIAVKSSGARRLIRALILIGVDPHACNSEKEKPSKLAKTCPENAKVLKFLAPGLWNAVEKGSKEDVLKLASNWCKIDDSRNNTTILQLAQQGGKDEIRQILNKRTNTNTFVYFVLAGDRAGMRPFFKKGNVDINTKSACYIDQQTSELISLPLVGEAAILGIPASVRKLLRKMVFMSHVVNGTPLYLYILQNIQANEKFYEVAEILLKKMDFSKNRGDIHTMLDIAYDKKFPMNLLRMLVANGLDLFAPDNEGHFLRDRILIKNAKESPTVIEQEVLYVDNILIDMAKNGCVDIIQNLAESSYDYINVSTPEGNSVKAGLAKSLGEVKAEKFMNDTKQMQNTFRELTHVIRIGHLAQVQNMLTLKLLKCRDRCGRSLFHRAVIYERHHVFRHLIKVKPDVAKAIDNFGRSPLFWACAIKDSGDMITVLKSLGCSMDCKDVHGVTPSDVQAMSKIEKQDLLMKERSLDPGMDTFLFFKYLDIKEAIRAGNLTRVEEVRSEIYRDIQTKDIMTKMFQTTPPQRCILQFAMDAKRDKIAKYLLTLGMDWTVKYRDGNEEISLMDAAKKSGMTAVEGYIQYQLDKAKKHKELIQKLRKKGVVKNVKNNNVTVATGVNDGSDVIAKTTADNKENMDNNNTNVTIETENDTAEKENQNNSKSCVLQ